MLKQKRYGRDLEQKVRDLLRKKNFYVFVKGISTKGTDIQSFKERNGRLLFLFFELKNYKNINENLLKKFFNQYKKNYKTDKNNIEKSIKNIPFEFKSYLLIYERQNKIYILIDINFNIKKFNKIDDVFNYILEEKIKKYLKK